MAILALPLLVVTYVLISILYRWALARRVEKATIDFLCGSVNLTDDEIRKKVQEIGAELKRSRWPLTWLFIPGED